jgi:hypothetical protein
VPIADEVSRLAEETGDDERALQARWLQHIAHLTRGDTTRFALLAYEYQRLADLLRQPSQQWYGTVMRSVWELLRGEFSEAQRLIEEAERLGERAQSWDSGFSYRVAMFVLRREQGRLAEIEDLIRGSVDEYPGYRGFRCLVVLLDHELGRKDEAQRAVDELAIHGFAAFPRTPNGSSVCAFSPRSSHRWGTVTVPRSSIASSIPLGSSARLRPARCRSGPSLDTSGSSRRRQNGGKTRSVTSSMLWC